MKSSGKSSKKYPPIDVFRTSASRPWQLEKSHPTLLKHLKYSGELRYHLIESVMVKKLSEKCVEWGKANGYTVHIIDPARGQGCAVRYALDHAITSKYALKWEDDFQAEVDIPLDNCVDVMGQYPKVNQICFNKRRTLAEKGAYGIPNWKKEQRYFVLENGKVIPLVVKEKWWFGSALWRVDFIKPKFKFWDTNTHNMLNDVVLLPPVVEHAKQAGRERPIASDVEEVLGTYIYGKTGDPRMVFHAGIGDSLWSGELQEKWRKEGVEIIGGGS